MLKWEYFGMGVVSGGAFVTLVLTWFVGKNIGLIVAQTIKQLSRRALTPKEGE